MFGSGLDCEQAFDTIPSMSRTRVRVRRRRLGVIVAVSLIGGVWAGPLAHARQSAGMSPVAQHRYVVQDGDTIWGIATRVAPGVDPRPLVDAIARANQVDPGALVPGQTLVIPSA